MALFRKTTKPADVVLIHGRCWDNPQLDEAVTRADDAELAPPERVEAALGLLPGPAGPRGGRPGADRAGLSGD